MGLLCSHFLCCVLPAFAVLCCALLCCAALCCAALCSAALCCAALCCAVLRCAVLCCAALCSAALRCALLRCAVLCCTVLCCAVLCRAVPCCAAAALLAVRRGLRSRVLRRRVLPDAGGAGVGRVRPPRLHQPRPVLRLLAHPAPAGACRAGVAAWGAAVARHPCGTVASAAWKRKALVCVAAALCECALIAEERGRGSIV